MYKREKRFPDEQKGEADEKVLFYVEVDAWSQTIINEFCLGDVYL